MSDLCELATQLSARLPALLGAHVLGTVVPVGDHLDALFPEERAVVARSVSKRQREFATGRVCARDLLARLGVEPAPLLPGADRAPRWPAGVVGSIAHSDELCVVAVARAGPVRALGIDVEGSSPLPEDLWPTVLRPDERQRLLALPPAERGRRAKLAFSAKEAAFKAQYGVTGRVLEFHSVEIVVAEDGGGFRAVIHAPRVTAVGDGGLVGRLVLAEGALVTAVVLREPLR